MFKENAAELRTLFRLSKVWKKSEQLSKLDYEIKYWTYSVWHRRARLKGSEYSESGYPVREEKGGWEHLEMWRIWNVSQFQEDSVKEGVTKHLRHKI